LRDGEKIYVEGGFRNNEAYKALLAGFFPSSETALTTLEQATSFGAAIVAKAARTGDAVESLADTFDITPRPVEPLIIKGMADYVTAFMQSLER
jgi:sugar (pentulose or hexulose) kinase